METGIKYDLTGENRRGEIVGYHSKPQPNFLNKSKHNIDVSGLKKATRNGTIIYNDFLEEHLCICIDILFFHIELSRLVLLVLVKVD